MIRVEVSGVVKSILKETDKSCTYEIESFNDGEISCTINKHYEGLKDKSLKIGQAYKLICHLKGNKRFSLTGNVFVNHILYVQSVFNLR